MGWSSKQWPPPPSPCLPQLVGSNSAATEGERYGDRLLGGSWTRDVDLSTWTFLSGCQMENGNGAMDSNLLGFQHHPLERCWHGGFDRCQAITKSFRTWDRIVYGMDVFFLSGAVRFVWFVWLTWQLLIAGARWYTLGSQGLWFTLFKGYVLLFFQHMFTSLIRLSAVIHPSIRLENQSW